MSKYLEQVEKLQGLAMAANGVNAEHAVRMRLQNQFKTGLDVAKYTGSTTGTTRNNTVCSKYTPITWQVDRKCHLISASSFDKMCADMKLQRDDMSGDFYAHGAREVVATNIAGDNLQRL